MAQTEDEDFQILNAIPWCSRLLSDSNFIRFPFTSRQHKPSTNEDAFFAETLKTKDTIRAAVSLYRRPSQGTVRTSEIRWLLTLGRKLDGYPNLCHGGITATLLDEIMGTLLVLNEKLENVAVRSQFVTAYLNIQYAKPVPTSDAAVMVTTRIKKTKGRKHFFEATLEDGEGNVLARAEGLHVQIREPKTKL